MLICANRRRGGSGLPESRRRIHRAIVRSRSGLFGACSRPAWILAICDISARAQYLRRRRPRHLAECATGIAPTRDGRIFFAEECVDVANEAAPAIHGTEASVQAEETAADRPFASGGMCGRSDTVSPPPRRGNSSAFWRPGCRTRGNSPRVRYSAQICC